MVLFKDLRKKSESLGVVHAFLLIFCWEARTLILIIEKVSRMSYAY